MEKSASTTPLLKDQDCFLTITSGNGGTAIYINGKLMRSYANHRMLAGVTEEPVRLILGNSSTGESYWNGNLTGLAIYNRALPADQVFKSYEAWKGKTPPPTSAEDGCLGMYLFNERKGTTVHNATNANDTLTIPERFKPVQRKILSPFLSGYKWNLSSAQDIITNILGFIPFGFFFSALLLKNHPPEETAGLSDHRHSRHGAQLRYRADPGLSPHAGFLADGCGDECRGDDDGHHHISDPLSLAPFICY